MATNNHPTVYCVICKRRTYAAFPFQLWAHATGEDRVCPSCVAITVSQAISKVATVEGWPTPPLPRNTKAAKA